MGKLDGKIAIVTGAGRGIGHAIAEAYLQEGASVTVTAAREQAELDHLAQQGLSEHVLPVLADVTDAQACQRVVDLTIQRFGQIDILVNNAGRGMKFANSSFMTAPAGFWEVDPAMWHMIIDTNVNGPFYMARAVVSHLIAQQRPGSIVNIGVSYTTMKRRGFSPYGPSKAALEAASAIWAQDLADSRIRVNILLPGGATNTGMLPSDASDDLRAGLIQPDIMKAPAVYLASDASEGLTGHRLVATEWSQEHPMGTVIADGIG